jgi:hypothetical protein
VPNAHVRAATEAGRPELQATAAVAAILTGWFSSSRRQAASQSQAESRTNHPRGELVHRIVALTDVCVTSWMWRESSWRAGSQGARRPVPRAGRRGPHAVGGGALRRRQPAGPPSRPTPRRAPASLSLPPGDDVEAAVVAAVEAHGYRMATAWARRRLGRAVNRTRAAIEYEMKPRELPLQRLGRPEKIANAIVFLAAKRASFITSTVLGIDGGSIRATA